MAKQNDALTKEIDQLRSDLTRLRDQARVRLHLGAMDARTAFADIERRADHVGHEISQTARATLAEVRDELARLLAVLRSAADKAPRA